MQVTGFSTAKFSPRERFASWQERGGKALTPTWLQSEPAVGDSIGTVLVAEDGSLFVGGPPSKKSAYLGYPLGAVPADAWGAPAA